MKKVFLIAGAFLTLTASAQKKTTPATQKPTAPAAPLLKNLTDSASYAIGLSVANFYSQQGLGKVNASVVAKAINDVLAGNKMLLSEQEAHAAMTRFINQAQAAKAQPTIAAGEQFLAKNKARPEVKTTASGLQYEIITEGTGAKPAATDSVTVHYKGTLIDGTEFDNSYKRGQPITFPLNGVIKGWTEGVQLMSEGSKYKLYIPHQLGYGTNDTGPIPAGSALIFEVELLKVTKK